MVHATDAAATIRVPATACGLWGLKPSRRAPLTGPDFGNLLMGLVGEMVVARSPRDVAAAFDLVAGRARGPFPDPAHLHLPLRPRIARMLPDRCGPALQQAAREVGRLLAEAGCDMAEATAPDARGLRAHAPAGRILCASLADRRDGLGIDESRSHPSLAPISAACAARRQALSGRQIFAMTRELAQLAHDA